MDEIQTDLGLIGNILCFDHYNISLDILALGKSLFDDMMHISAIYLMISCYILNWSI